MTSSKKYWKSHELFPNKQSFNFLLQFILILIVFALIEWIYYTYKGKHWIEIIVLWGFVLDFFLYLIVFKFINVDNIKNEIYAPRPSPEYSLGKRNPLYPIRTAFCFNNTVSYEYSYSSWLLVHQFHSLYKMSLK